MITKIRASKITIETPVEGSETWIHITVQKVTKHTDGTIINVIPRYDFISFPLQNIGTDMYTVMEPLTQQGTVTPQGDVIL